MVLCLVNPQRLMFPWYGLYLGIAHFWVARMKILVTMTKDQTLTMVLVTTRASVAQTTQLQTLTLLQR